MPRGRFDALPDLVRALPARQLIPRFFTPLSAIAGRLLADARAYGSQLDEQTILPIRRN